MINKQDSQLPDKWKVKCHKKTKVKEKNTSAWLWDVIRDWANQLWQENSAGKSGK